MQGRQPRIQPGVIHQGRKAIEALQQQRPTGAGRQHRRILRRRTTGLRLQPGQGALQRIRGDLGGTAPAGHRLPARHGRAPRKPLHEAPINALLPAPEQPGGSEGPGPVEGDGTGSPVTEQLQRPGLGMPGGQAPLWLLDAALEVAGQQRCSPHRPDPRGGPGIAANQAAVTRGKQLGMALHRQARLRPNPAAQGIAGQAAGRQPRRSFRTGAGQIRRCVRAHMAAQGNPRLGQQALPGAVGRRRTQVQLLRPQQQAGLMAAGDQRESQLHRRGPATPDRDRARCLLQPRQEGLQRFDPELSGGLPGLAAHIQAEAIKGQRWPPGQQQLRARQIQARDLGSHEGHTGSRAEIAQINRALAQAVKPRHQARHHPRIQGRAAAIHQHHLGVLGLELRPHQPTPQQQGVAVATTRQKQQLAGTGHGRSWAASPRSMPFVSMR